MMYGAAASIDLYFWMHSLPVHFITTMSADLHDQVLVLWFGQFPDGTDSLASQLFAVAMATVGLGAFAIVLALVEQVLPPLPKPQIDSPIHQ